MYKIFLIFSTIVCFIRVNAQQIRHQPPIDGYKYVQIDDADHDFGNIEYGKMVKYVVKMKNISDDTLMLTNVIVSCGCTLPQYATGAYAPGAEIGITIGFNGYTEGKFSKTLSVLFQDNKVGQIVKILRFSGNGVVQNKTSE